jgi:hypothetical protein
MDLVESIFRFIRHGENDFIGDQMSGFSPNGLFSSLANRHLTVICLLEPSLAAILHQSLTAVHGSLMILFRLRPRLRLRLAGHNGFKNIITGITGSTETRLPRLSRTVDVHLADVDGKKTVTLNTHGYWGWEELNYPSTYVAKDVTEYILDTRSLGGRIIDLPHKSSTYDEDRDHTPAKLKEDPMDTIVKSGYPAGLGL